MSKLFGPAQRALQDQFDTRAIADRIEAIALATEIDERTKGFIESRDMFFLATVSAQGQPTCSYKGGEPGFVQVLDATTIAFPSYDGNGMFLSLGNAAETSQVGLLFIDFETPNRLRLQGRAELVTEGPLLERFREAELVVKISVTELWPNCPRYVHRYQKLDQSRYVPTEACETPLAEWKRIDIVQDALPAKDQGRAEKAGGIISIEDWFAKVGEGNG
jgi:predicted pyridoxine 5'-phosphate oxidase superfamily flavin-nucleotide-binding protein